MTSTFLRAALGSVALIAACSVASAADMYRKAPPATPVAAPVTAYNWTGLYAGANVGGSWLRDKIDDGVSDTTVNPATIFGGLQAGYNYQIGQWVIGAETDVGYGHAKKSATLNGVDVSGQKSWEGTVRARAGYAFDRFLVYGTGGLAWANFKLEDDVSSKTTTRAGWTLGAGAEYAVTQNISVKGEYLYADYGKPSINGTSHDLSDNLVRVGVNYKF